MGIIMKNISKDKMKPDFCSLCECITFNGETVVECLRKAADYIEEQELDPKLAEGETVYEVNWSDHRDCFKISFLFKYAPDKTLKDLKQ